MQCADRCITVPYVDIKLRTYAIATMVTFNYWYSTDNRKLIVEWMYIFTKLILPVNILLYIYFHIYLIVMYTLMYVM